MSRGMGRKRQHVPTSAPIAPSWEQLVAEAMAPRPAWCDWTPWFDWSPPAESAPEPAPVKPEGSLLGLLDGDDRVAAEIENAAWLDAHGATQLMPVIEYVLAHPFEPREIKAVSA